VTGLTLLFRYDTHCTPTLKCDATCLYLLPSANRRPAPMPVCTVVCAIQVMLSSATLVPSWRWPALASTHLAVLASTWHNPTYRHVIVCCMTAIGP
jgi:hypothetical protein